MTVYIAIPSTDTDSGSPVDVSLIERLRDNLLAVIENDASAPEIDGGAIAAATILYSALNLANSIVASDIAANAVDTSELAAGAVVRAKLDTTANTSQAGNLSNAGTSITLSPYSFFPMIHVSNVGTNGSGEYLTSKSHMTGHVTDGASADSPRFSLVANRDTGYGATTYDVDYRYINA